MSLITPTRKLIYTCLKLVKDEPLLDVDRYTYTLAVQLSIINVFG